MPEPNAVPKALGDASLRRGADAVPDAARRPPHNRAPDDLTPVPEEPITPHRVLHTGVEARADKVLGLAGGRQEQAAALRAAIQKDYPQAVVLDGNTTWTAQELNDLAAGLARVPAKDLALWQEDGEDRVALIRDRVSSLNADAEATTHIHSHFKNETCRSTPLPHTHVFDLAFTAQLEAIWEGAVHKTFVHEAGHVRDLITVLRLENDAALIVHAYTQAFEEATALKPTLAPAPGDPLDVKDFATQLITMFDTYVPPLAATAAHIEEVVRIVYPQLPWTDPVPGVWTDHVANVRMLIAHLRRQLDGLRQDARDLRAALDAVSGIRPEYVTACEKFLDVVALGDSSLAAELTLAARVWTLLKAEQRHIEYFVHRAAVAGFEPPTQYARTTQHEWFAETYALAHTFPDKLRTLSKNMYDWFVLQQLNDFPAHLDPF